MQTLVIDANSIVKKLEQRGFSRVQAERITVALKELDTSTLVRPGYGQVKGWIPEETTRRSFSPYWLSRWECQRRLARL